MADQSEEKTLPASDKKLRDARRKGQVALLQISENETASLCSKQHRKCGVLCILDGVDGIHHDTETKVFAHFFLGRRGYAPHPIMLVAARICPPAHAPAARRRATFEKRDVHCIAGGVPIC